MADKVPLPEPVDYQIRLAGGRWTHCAKHIHEAAIQSGAAETRALYSADQMISFRATDNATLLGEVLALKKAIALAYGHLWSINEEPGTPSPIYPAMQAAYEARKILRGPLTTEQRGNGIDAASAAREVPHG